MSDIYALQGRAACGKTPTLNIVYNEIVNKYKVQPAKIQRLPPSITGEIKAILSITSASGSHTVGIASQGDPPPNFILDKTLDDFVKAGCDIIFCACRTRGITKNRIKAHTQYTHHFIPQNILPSGSTAQQETQRNTATAKNLIQRAGL